MPPGATGGTAPLAWPVNKPKPWATCPPRVPRGTPAGGDAHATHDGIPFAMQASI